jgi:hypothetical protein
MQIELAETEGDEADIYFATLRLVAGEKLDG